MIDADLRDELLCDLDPINREAAEIVQRRISCPEVIDGYSMAALAQPDWPGYDTLRTAGSLFFVELPLAMIVTFSGVLRIDDKEMDRAKKSSFVLMPIVPAELYGRVRQLDWRAATVSGASTSGLLRSLEPGVYREPFKGKWLRAARVLRVRRFSYYHEIFTSS